MNRKEHFEKYINTEQQIMEDPILSKQIIFLRDEEMQDQSISSSLIRQLVN